MQTDKIDEKREQFKNLLFQLAESQMTLSSPKQKVEIYKDLEALYYFEDPKTEFRHFYSDIFAVLTLIDNDETLGNTEILSQNMDIVRVGYKPINRDASSGKIIDITKQINKLYDHINLDIARINYSKTIELRSQGELQKINDSVEGLETNLNKADDLQKQYITILGIFASIVLAFTGGIAFSTSVLENISNASIFRISLIALFLAFILINVIYILTRFIMEINKKKGQIIRYPTYMISINVVMLVFLLLIILAWLFDVEKAAELFQNWIY